MDNADSVLSHLRASVDGNGLKWIQSPFDRGPPQQGRTQHHTAEDCCD